MSHALLYSVHLPGVFDFMCNFLGRFHELSVWCVRVPIRDSGQSTWVADYSPRFLLYPQSLVAVSVCLEVSWRLFFVFTFWCSSVRNIASVPEVSQFLDVTFTLSIAPDFMQENPELMDCMLFAFRRSGFGFLLSCAGGSETPLAEKFCCAYVVFLCVFGLVCFWAAPYLFAYVFRIVGSVLLESWAFCAVVFVGCVY